MNEHQFNRIMRVMEQTTADILPGGFRNWQPTLEELQMSMAGQNIEELVPVLMFLSIHSKNKEVVNLCRKQLAELEVT